MPTHARYIGIILSWFVLSLLSYQVQAAVGRTAGSFNVSSTGTASYQIPIWMPPGPNGLQPHLAISYDSRASDGTMGPGWSIAGLSAITRCNKTFAQDTAPAAVALNATDGYCLNGNRLRLISGTYGAAGSTYQSEMADFSQITANGAAGNGPASFTVQGKNGLIYEYGNTTDSRIIATSTSTASQWLLSKVRDRSGNSYIVTYGSGQAGTTGFGVPTSVSYTPTSPNAATYRYSVNFVYGPDSTYGTGSSEVGYVGGTLIKNTNLLTSVSVVNSAQTVLRKYIFNYQAAPTTTRARLSQVKECSDDAASDCLLPTNIVYQDGQAGVAGAATTAISADSIYGIQDINGDGRADIVYISGGMIYVAFAVPNGYSAGISTGVAYASLARFADLTGTGRAGFAIDQGGTWKYVSWNGSAFSMVATVPNLADAAMHTTFADVTGDGLPDLIYYQNNFIWVRVNTSVGGVLSFSATPTQAMSFSPAGFIAWFIANAAAPTSDRRGAVDINGDGREDIVITSVAGGCGGYPVVTCNYQTLSRGYVTTGPVTAPTLLPPNNYSVSVSPTFYGNLNSDNCTDMVGGTTVVISACNGSAALQLTISGTPLGLMDWDGDGRDDVIVNNAGTVGVYLSKGDSLSSMITTTIPTAGVNSFFRFDQNGDGLDDLAFNTGSAAPYTLSYRLHNGTGTPPDLVTSITEGYVSATDFYTTYSPTYVSIAQSNYTKGTGATYPEQDIQSPMYVVGNVSTSDGIGGTFTQTYAYTGARRDISGRGLLGFQSRTVTDSRANAPVQKTYFQTAFPFTGMVSQQDVYQNNGTTLISHTINTPSTLPASTLDGTANNQRYFPYTANAAVDTYEVGGTKNGALLTQSSTNFTYDNYGNLTASTSTITDKDGTAPQSPTYTQSWTTAVVNTFYPDTANWCLSLPTRTIVTKSGTGSTETAFSRRTDLTPDYVNCRITQTIVEPTSTLYKVTTDIGYDNFGNVNSQTVTGIGMTARTTTVDWGTTGQFPISVTNALSQTSQFGYDYSKGVQSSQTDPNGLVTAWQYDSFARKTLETRPDNTTTSWSYNACASVSGGCQNGDPNGATGINKMVVIATTKGTDGATILGDVWTYFDQLSRPIVTKSKTLSGGYSRVGVQYDSLGRMSRQTAPCDAASCTVYWTTFTNDALNRVTQIQRPTSANDSTPQTTSIAYQGMTTVTTDPQNKQTTKVTDPNGWARQTKDANGYAVNFAYDAFGSVKTVVDSASNTLFSASYAYGIGAFQTQTVDMDLGTWNYTNIDALGEVLNYTDANNATFTMTYDKLSRPLTKTAPVDGTTTWTWGTSAAGHNIGQLAGITNTGGTTESYTYDSKGRLSQRHIVSDAAYDYNYNYDATTGLLDTQTYPTSTSSYRFALKYVYQNGLLAQLKDNNTGKSYWQANAMNVRGQVTQEALGNGIVTNRNYDAVTGQINSIQSGVGGGTGVQNESYLFDSMGNVIQRQNNALGLTESFCYDNVYRLTKSALSGDSTCTTGNNLTVGYDNLGNIINRSDVASNATWTYDATKKHAVRQAGSSSFTYNYDANGNAITRNGYSIGWNKSNYPTSIAGSGETASFYYDGNNQRWKQVYVSGATTETTLYIGDLLEKVTSGSTTDWRHYIKVGSQTIAVYSRLSSGTNTFRYMLEDHQGSIAKITSDTGAIYVSENFSAFGNRRNPATWSGAPTASDLTNINAVSREGYTGQDFIGSLGLNHMNGRVQDAITGRFLSPDPYITEQGNTQNYNRYSYVYNNPMTLDDPSGFKAHRECYSTFTEDEDSSGGLIINQKVVCENVEDPDPLPASPGADPTDGGGTGKNTGTPNKKSSSRTVSLPQAPQTQKPDKCVNYAQVGAGLLGAGLGAAQFTEGALEAVVGVGGALETGGGSLLLVGKGVVDVGLGAVSFRDGLSLLQTGFDGVQRGSTFGNIGALVGGENGRTGGEMINAALGIRGLTGAIKSGKAGSSGFIADLTNNVLSTVLPDSLRPCQ